MIDSKIELRDARDTFHAHYQSCPYQSWRLAEAIQRNQFKQAQTYFISWSIVNNFNHVITSGKVLVSPLFLLLVSMTRNDGDRNRS